MDRRRDERRRHGPPGSSALTTVVTTAALAYGTYRLVSWAWDQYRSDDGNQQQRQQNVPHQQQQQPSRSAPRAAGGGGGGSDSPQRWRVRRQRMTRCREEVFRAVEGFLPTLQRIIEGRTSTRSETQAMKALRAERSSPTTPEPSPLKGGTASASSSPNSAASGDEQQQQQQYRREHEQELWNAIQIKLLTRMLATAYAHTILFLVLTVQVNLLGGRLLEEQLSAHSGQMSSLASAAGESVASDRMGDYQASHRFVLLHTYDYFFEHGLLSLINTVERAVTDVLNSDNAKWNVFDKSSLNVSRERLEELIGAIRTAVEDGQIYPSSSRGAARHRRPPRSLFRFLMPPSAHVETPMEDELAASILDETWDLVESPVMMDAQQDCLHTTFDVMREQHWGTLFVVTETGERTTRSLARVIPQLKHTAASFYQQQQQVDHQDYYGTSSDIARQEPAVNSYCSMMQALPTVLELADVCF